MPFPTPLDVPTAHGNSNMSQYGFNGQILPLEPVSQGEHYPLEAHVASTSAAIAAAIAQAAAEWQGGSDKDDEEEDEDEENGSGVDDKSPDTG